MGEYFSLIHPFIFKLMESFKNYMQRCEVLAAEAAKTGNAPVGCIIVKGNKIIAEASEAGVTKKDITAHAEMEAIRLARMELGKDLSGTLMITTHEPCVMCAYAIRYHRISTLVYRDAVDHLGGATSRFNILTTDETPEHWGAPPKIIVYKTRE